MTHSGSTEPAAMLERVGTDLERVLQTIKDYLSPLSRRSRLRALACEADFHHIRGEKDCDIAVGKSALGYYAECRTHDVRPEGHWRSAAAAQQEFLCDRGKRWNFIIHHRDDCERPRMVDLTELWEEVRSIVQNGGYVPSTGEMDLIALYRYTDTDVRIPLEIKAFPLRGLQQRELEAAGVNALPGPQAQVDLPVEESEVFLVVVHAEDEEPDLRLSSVPFSPADPQVTSAYDGDHVTYLRMAYARQ